MCIHTYNFILICSRLCLSQHQFYQEGKGTVHQDFLGHWSSYHLVSISTNIPMAFHLCSLLNILLHVAKSCRKWCSQGKQAVTFTTKVIFHFANQQNSGFSSNFIFHFSSNPILPVCILNFVDILIFKITIVNEI